MKRVKTVKNGVKNILNCIVDTEVSKGKFR